jgi:hypothetical protein
MCFRWFSYGYCVDTQYINSPDILWHFGVVFQGRKHLDLADRSCLSTLLQLKIFESNSQHTGLWLVGIMIAFCEQITSTADYPDVQDDVEPSA